MDELYSGITDETAGDYIVRRFNALRDRFSVVTRTLVAEVGGPAQAEVAAERAARTIRRLRVVEAAAREVLAAYDLPEDTPMEVAYEESDHAVAKMRAALAAAED